MNFSGIDNINNYTEYTYDEVLKQYYAQNRFYDPENRRFTQEDDVEDGDNWYNYCNNNPVNYIDLLGEAAKQIQLYGNMFAGSVIGMVSDAYKDVTDPVDIKDVIEAGKSLLQVGKQLYRKEISVKDLAKQSLKSTFNNSKIGRAHV